MRLPKGPHFTKRGGNNCPPFPKKEVESNGMKIKIHFSSSKWILPILPVGTKPRALGAGTGIRLRIHVPNAKAVLSSIRPLNRVHAFSIASGCRAVC